MDNSLRKISATVLGVMALFASSFAAYAAVGMVSGNAVNPHVAAADVHHAATQESFAVVYHGGYHGARYGHAYGHYHGAYYRPYYGGYYGGTYPYYGGYYGGSYPYYGGYNAPYYGGYYGHYHGPYHGRYYGAHVRHY